MKKLTIEQLRQEYQSVTGKEAAIRWNRKTLERKIRDARLIREADLAEARQTGPEPASQRNENFERLAAESLSQQDQPNDQSGDGSGVPRDTPDESRKDGPGGSRPGAGRPTGQTTERARIERLMALEVPDLGVLVCVRSINRAVGRLTGVPFDKEGCTMIALGCTQMILYWFPSLEGRTGPVSLHLHAVGLLWQAAERRNERMASLMESQDYGKADHEKENEKEGGEQRNTGVGRASARKSRKSKSGKNTRA